MKLDIKVQRLAQARAASGISLKDLAELVGVSSSTLSSMENGHHKPSKVLFNSVCRILSVNTRWIEHGEQPIFMTQDALRGEFAKFMGANIAYVDPSGTTIFTPQGKKNNLHFMQHLASSEDVKPQLPSLLAKLRKFTAARGMKSQLAAYIGRATGKRVPLSSVSRWLSGEVEPGGEAALLMQKWADDPERQQK